MDIEQVLGYVNRYVEHAKVKVVLLFDSKKLVDKKRNKKAKKMLEKIVRNIYVLEQDPDEVFDELNHKLVENANIKNAIAEVKPVVLEHFKSSGAKNYRSLQQVIDRLRRLFDLLESATPESVSEFEKTLLQIRSQIAVTVTILVMEKTLGAITDEEIPKLNSSANYLEEASEKGSIENKYKSAFDLFRNHPKYLKLSSIDDYFLKGFIEEESFKNQIRNLFPNASPVEKNAQFWASGDFKFLSDSEYREKISETFQFIKDGAYGNVTAWWNVFSHMILASSWELIDKNPDELKEMCLKGVQEAISRKKLSPIRSHEMPPEINDNEHTIEFGKQFEQILNNSWFESYRDKARMMLEEDPDAFLNWYKSSEHNDLLLSDWLNADEAVKSITGTARNETRWHWGSEIRREVEMCHREDREKSRKWLKQVQDGLNEWLQGKSVINKPSVFIVQNIVNVIDRRLQSEREA